MVRLSNIQLMIFCFVGFHQNLIFCLFYQIIFIDLILHKTKAYRHLLYNVFTQETIYVQVKSQRLYFRNTLCVLSLFQKIDSKRIYSYLIFRGFHNLAASVVEVGLGLSSSRYLYPFLFLLYCNYTEHIILESL